jgi:DNA mismatch repair protein MutL
MGLIRKLPPELMNQIAAGEVIERPASVVKELVENALDAGARSIEIALEDGGRRLVRVADDGAGIAAEDLPLAVESHATSKLACVEDLFSVKTLGFRGEALASMGSVAELRVASRREDAAEGAEIRVRGGAVEPVRPAARGRGTTVEVRDLFFNTPARRKFLRDTAGELRAALEALTRLALGAPAVAFRLTHRAGEGPARLVLEARPTEDPLERIADLFGREVADDLVAIRGARGAARISGFAALPRRTRGDASQQHVVLRAAGGAGFRPIRDRLVSGAIREAYQGFLMSRRHPIVFLALEVPAEEVDVNVHPAKLEVRFREPREVFGLVRAAILEALEARREAPALTPAGRVAEAAPRWEMRPPPRSAPPLLGGEEKPPAWSTPGPAAGLAFPSPPAPRHLQLASGYLIVEAGRGFEVIDPHALHERVLYEEWKARLAAGAVEVQPLLVPAIVEVTAAEDARAEELREPLAALGVVLEPFGPGALAVQAVPALLARERDWAAIVRGLLAAEEDGAGPSRAALLERLTATLACKAAVKLGERLGAAEVAALLARREAAERSHLGPHGRPTALAFSEGDLERQFKR